jgi:hypothetical protein
MQRRDEPSGESDEARPKATRPSGFAPVTLGPCPLCGSEVLDQPKSYRFPSVSRRPGSHSGTLARIARPLFFVTWPSISGQTTKCQ